MFVAIYRWKIREHKKREFIRKWLEISGQLKKTKGCLGARLHRHQDGTFVSYAQWTDKSSMKRAAKHLDQHLFRAIHEEFIEEYLPVGEMQVIADLLDGIGTLAGSEPVFQD